ncbi:ABC transporter permease [Natronobacterium gregoryi]|uniref:ABC transporter permease n=2 Tax=Natronobacterium gregoryi TaxID=44930 RepID=L0ALJ4_NATGS|nr:ABC transporter permease [Natronobacterium gregoryi]AFZ74641.1 hypothetical protein Natgr_3523 [Natronobacterium gregoryi SP2]ELY72541.1 hypothetical protein C490_03093 [Natronobacterium gregoryi SP2]PLK19823.1 ABC transporter permease [Natronobacterium gregoryi SP2]SFJ31097.1 hypothetical protein SAMN05443661_12160 [Natronobacterium gregoryi]
MTGNTYQHESEEEKENQKTNIQYIGEGIRTVLYWVKIAVIGIAPFFTLLVIAFFGLLDVLGFGLFGDPYGGFLNIAFWFIILSLIPGTVVAYMLYRTDDRELFATNVANGGVGGGFELSERDWSDLDVYLYDSDAPRFMGEKTNTSALNFNGNFYEAVAYYKDDNIAVAPDIGNMSMYELRVHEDKLEKVIEDRDGKYQAAVETDSRRKDYATEDAARETNRMIRDFERETLAEGELPNSPVREHIEETERKREEEDHDLREGQYQLPDRDKDDSEGGDDE